MTSVAFGGGPSLIARRQFAGFKEGTHTPGYVGYCPHMKYRCGKTFGQDTHELAQIREHVHPVPVTVDPNHNLMTKGSSSRTSIRFPNAAPNADLKYVDGIIPGYSAYIPKLIYKHGETYTNTCNRCVDQMMGDKQNQLNNRSELSQLQRSLPDLTVKASPRVVKNTLDLYKDKTLSQKPILKTDRVSITEPRIPGYVGYIPRLKPTESGLGNRYWEGTNKSLDLFAREQHEWRSKTAPEYLTRKEPTLEQVNLNRPPAPEQVLKATVNEIDRAFMKRALTQPEITLNENSKRIYVPPGMIPKYTGYCPQYIYRFGNTFGDTTRKLDVCSHTSTSFGDHQKAVTASSPNRYTIPA